MREPTQSAIGRCQHRVSTRCVLTDDPPCGWEKYHTHTRFSARTFNQRVWRLLRCLSIHDLRWKQSPTASEQRQQHPSGVLVSYVEGRLSFGLWHGPWLCGWWVGAQLIFISVGLRGSLHSLPPSALRAHRLCPPGLSSLMRGALQADRSRRRSRARGWG